MPRPRITCEDTPERPRFRHQCSAAVLCVDRYLMTVKHCALRDAVASMDGPGGLAIVAREESCVLVASVGDWCELWALVKAEVRNE